MMSVLVNKGVVIKTKQRESLVEYQGEIPRRAKQAQCCLCSEALLPFGENGRRLDKDTLSGGNTNCNINVTVAILIRWNSF